MVRPDGASWRLRALPGGTRGSRPRVLSACVALSLAMLLGACDTGVHHEGDRDLHAVPRISPTPPMAGPADLRVVASDANGPLPDGATVTAIPVDPQGLRGRATALGRQEDGAWVGQVDFAAPGQGGIILEIRLPGGRSASIRYPVTITRRP